MNSTGRLAIRTALLASCVTAVPASAQSGASADQDIIVTARKRDETSIAVPVVLTAVSGAQLERRAMVKLDDLARSVPQLQIGQAGGSLQGGQIGIRGIAGSGDNPFADQAVSFNIDGVQVSRANIRRLSEMDIGQIEVLKGPQALFFGKNSPGGIISVRSADPTSTFQAKLSAGYEFRAHEWRGDGFISGPLSDTLSARLAVAGSKMRGWSKNDVDGSTFYRDSPRNTPQPKEFGIRGTLKWEPTDAFSSRTKASFSKIKDFSFHGGQERMYCPYGVPQLGTGTLGTAGYNGGPDTCKLDGRGVRLQMDPYLSTLNSRFPKDGVPFYQLEQALFSHEMNLNLSDVLTATSVTGYYYLEQKWADNFNSGWNPANGLPSAGAFGNRELSQELRLSSSYEGPVNFLVGAYIQKAKAHNGATTFRGYGGATGTTVTQLNDYYLIQKGLAYSWFGQALIKPIEQIEISIGGRYSHERKRLSRIDAWIPTGVAPLPARVPVPLNPNSPRHDKWSDFSPEFTVSYRPSQNLTVFASRKRGFLSGGFNSGATNFNTDLRFDQQVIKGWEGGVKASLLGGALRTNFGAYYYKITGLQVSTSVSVPGGAPVQTVINAGKVTIKGAEADFTYKTPLDGLSIHGAVGYNDAKYNRFVVGCYAGQTQEQGCNTGPFTDAIVNGTSYRSYTAQDLAGHELVRSPKWSGNFGAEFDQDIGTSLNFGMNLDMMFSSSYDTREVAIPNGRQKSYQTLDGGVRIGAQDRTWELALIGRNLTNKYYIPGRAYDMALTGSGAGRAANDPRGTTYGDIWGVVARGREIMLRATVRYGAD